jgi:hypothetical protein
MDELVFAVISGLMRLREDFAGRVVCQNGSGVDQILTDNSSEVWRFFEVFSDVCAKISFGK